LGQPFEFPSKRQGDVRYGSRGGKPSRIEVGNYLFSSTEKELERAKEVVEACEEAKPLETVSSA
jgi:hypothetical protein